jgi:hypothetical protein
LSIDVKKIINPVVAGEVSDHEPRTTNYEPEKSILAGN